MFGFLRSNSEHDIRIYIVIAFTCINFIVCFVCCRFNFYFPFFSLPLSHSCLQCNSAPMCYSISTVFHICTQIHTEPPWLCGPAHAHSKLPNYIHSTLFCCMQHTHTTHSYILTNHTPLKTNTNNAQRTHIRQNSICHSKYETLRCTIYSDCHAINNPSFIHLDAVLRFQFDVIYSLWFSLPRIEFLYRAYSSNQQSYFVCVKKGDNFSSNWIFCGSKEEKKPYIV